MRWNFSIIPNVQLRTCAQQSFRLWHSGQGKDHQNCVAYSLYPPHNEVVGGYIGFTPSVCPSRIPCPLCSIYSSGWILSIFGTNDQQHERVCCMCWPLTLTYISRSFGLDLENRVRAVASTVLDGFILYLAQMITIIRGCVAYYAFFQNLKIWIFGKFLKKIRPRPWKRNLQFSMDSFHI